MEISFHDRDPPKGLLMDKRSIGKVFSMSCKRVVKGSVLAWLFGIFTLNLLSTLDIYLGLFSYIKEFQTL